MKSLAVLLALMLLASPASFARYAEDIDDVLRIVQTPEDLARWLSSEFAYRMMLPDGPHTPQEVLRSRSGDCDDLAGLASAVLTRMGIANEVIVIHFRDLKIAHAVCAWKDKGGRYSFISNNELWKTGQKTLGAAIMKVYPDCESMNKLDPRMYVCL